MSADYGDDLHLALQLADLADTVALSRFRAIDLRVATKPDRSPVTEADTAVEDAIWAEVARQRPDDARYGEESGSVGGVRGRCWVLDPIDGTANFVRGVPVWATLVALEEDGEVVAGCVSAPALGRRWWASKGTGAYTGKSLMSSREIRVSRVTELDNASLSYASLGGWDAIGKGDAFAALIRRCWRTRAYGDFYSYMLLAEGAVDIAAEPELKVWDMAALDIVVREAGGTFTSLAGKAGPWGDNALATNTRLHDAAMAYVGHFPDTEPPERSWHGEPEPSESKETLNSNVHNFEFTREPSDEVP